MSKYSCTPSQPALLYSVGMLSATAWSLGLGLTQGPFRQLDGSILMLYVTLEALQMVPMINEACFGPPINSHDHVRTGLWLLAEGLHPSPAFADTYLPGWAEICEYGSAWGVYEQRNQQYNPLPHHGDGK